MRCVHVALSLLTVVLACGGGGSSDGGGSSSSSTGDAEESSSTTPIDEFPLECDPALEIHFPDDEVGFGLISIDALRVHNMETDAVEYDLYLHGDDAELTQIIIRFIGTPLAGLSYAATEASGVARPVVQLFPDNGSLMLKRGSVKWTEVGTAMGESLELELRLELNTGRLQGCISVPLVAQG